MSAINLIDKMDYMGSWMDEARKAELEYYYGSEAESEAAEDEEIGAEEWTEFENEFLAGTVNERRAR